jgi:RNA polymerase sigma-70 factor, ECF subfamily
VSPDDLVAVYRDSVRGVFRYLMRLTCGDRALSEDLTQEVFAIVVREAQRDRLPIPPGAWLNVVARNTFLQHARSASRTERHMAQVGADPAEVDDATDELHGRMVTIDALRGLPAHERTALILHHDEGLSIAEIAQLLGRSVNATDSILVRARLRLRRSLEERVA